MQNLSPISITRAVAKIHRVFVGKVELENTCIGMCTWGVTIWQVVNKQLCSLKIIRARQYNLFCHRSCGEC